MAVIFARTSRVAVFLALVVAASLSACAPAPQPSPTPTPAFASEEEAFAAAEAVYRAYIDAFNAVDLQNPETFEPLTEYTAGDYESSEREDLSGLQAGGFTREGMINILWIKPLRTTDSGFIYLRTCNDVSSTSVSDRDGNPLAPADRPSTFAIDLELEIQQGVPVLVGSTAVEDEACVLQ